MLRSIPCAVRESPEFLAQATEVFGSIPQWDEIKWAIEFTLARDPTAVDIIAGTPNWRGVTLLTSPPRTLCFRYDETDDVIYLEALF